MPKLVIFNAFTLLDRQWKMSQIMHFYGVNFLAWKSGGVVHFLKNIMSEQCSDMNITLTKVDQ